MHSAPRIRFCSPAGQQFNLGPDPAKDWLAFAHGQAGASAQREARLFLRHARRDLQRLIGDFEGKDLLFSFFKSQHGLHGTILSFASGAKSQLRVA